MRSFEKSGNLLPKRFLVVKAKQAADFLRENFSYSPIFSPGIGLHTGTIGNSLSRSWGWVLFFYTQGRTVPVRLSKTRSPFRKTGTPRRKYLPVSNSAGLDPDSE
jgi:hypothetical protein